MTYYISARMFLFFEHKIMRLRIAVLVIKNVPEGAEVRFAVLIIRFPGS